MELFCIKKIFVEIVILLIKGEEIESLGLLFLKDMEIGLIIFVSYL